LGEIKTYQEFTRSESLSTKARNAVRASALALLSVSKRISAGNNWIRFPYYHHVFDDERKGFERQLKFLKNFGEYISMDQAHEMINSQERIDGRYFCVSFDDGFSNCRNNMMEITAGLEIPVIIYLPTDFIGLQTDKEADLQKIKSFYPEDEHILSFLNWEECKSMLPHQISFGSHTCSHANLARCTPEQIRHELSESKRIIEQQLGVPCPHFACPWGRSGIDFIPEVTTPIAQELGYKTFATTNRGAMTNGDDPFLLKRDHLIAGWSDFQLKYFFGQ